MAPSPCRGSALGKLSPQPRTTKDLRKQAESYREMGRDILQILNEPGDLQESIQRILATLKARTGFERPSNSVAWV